MASVWATRGDGKTELRLAGYLTSEGAKVALAMFADEWQRSARGRKVVWNSKMDVSLFEGGRATGLMWCEFMSPPSAPEPGQPKRQKA